MVRKITLSQLEVFVTAADAGSFSKASAELGCTQSRISHAIAELEHQIGASLLVRSRSGCVLTLEGHRVMARARELLRVAASIIEDRHFAPGASGVVRFACMPSVSTHLLPHIVEDLRTRHPGIQVDIQECHHHTQVVALVNHDEAQVGVARGPFTEDLISMPYVSDSYVVIAPAALRLKSPACWQELSSLPMIQLHPSEDSSIIDQCRAAGLHSVFAHRLVNVNTALTLVARGFGYAVLPRLMAFPDIAGTQVLPLPFTARRNLRILISHASATAAHVTTFMKVALEKQVMMRSTAWKDSLIGFDY